ncbi:MAG: hypothetical protein Ct9H300mP15_11220 [Gemmatimonadota bacterium]|nr:MAG: hypothetical protein Ct9H300mP15_11220 [Gemmatimonadota bacterium]
MSFISSIKTLLTFGRGVVGGLPDGTEDKDPINLFRGWFEAAKKSGILLPEAMSLATSTPDGRPSVRMVLLKDVDLHGFAFYTNYGSQKASEIDRNPYAASAFTGQSYKGKSVYQAKLRESQMTKAGIIL